MTGWLTLVVMLAALAGLFAMVLGRLGGQLELAAAALMIGSAGYAWQGSPAQSGSPQAATSIANMDATTDVLLALRSKMDRSFSPARSWLISSDGLARAGDLRGAAAYIEGGLIKNPRDADLWNALGVQMLLIGEGRLSPAAELAFARARALNPRHPGPDYFAGLAFLGAGEPARTAMHWRRALAKAGPNAEWAPIVRNQLTSVEALLSAPNAAVTRARSDQTGAP